MQQFHPTSRWFSLRDGRKWWALSRWCWPLLALREPPRRLSRKTSKIGTCGVQCPCTSTSRRIEAFASTTDMTLRRCHCQLFRLWSESHPCHYLCWWSYLIHCVEMVVAKFPCFLVPSAPISRWHHGLSHRSVWSKMITAPSMLCHPCRPSYESYSIARYHRE